MGNKKISGNIRIANINDSYRCREICKNAFPYNIKWQDINGYSKRWWDYVLETDTTDVGVFVSEDQILGLAVLLVKEKEFLSDMSIMHMRGKEKFKIIFIKPRVLLHELNRKRIFKKAYKSFDKNKNIKRIGKRTWVELTAVSPVARRKGIGSSLRKWCENRTSALGFEYIESNIEPDNIANRSLVEKYGYIHSNQTIAGCTYSKKLE
ncbi:MAG: GNAT family N-acetyltransferase [bacterium]